MLLNCLSHASNLHVRLTCWIVYQGFAIGNGLTDPAIQYNAYTDFSLDNKIISKSDHDSINKLVPECEKDIKLCGNSSSWHIEY